MSSDIKQSREAASSVDVEPLAAPVPKPADELAKEGPFRRLGRGVPTLLVFAALAGIGYWGHQNNWTVPKFSQLTGNSATHDADWCDEHGVPAEICIACNANLMPKEELYGWCREHGIHECILHHPNLVQLPETPEITQADLDRATRAIALRPRSKNDPLCKKHLRRLQFVSREAADKAGIDIDLVTRGPIVEAVTATGEVIYDPTRVARLASRAAGTVWRVEKNVGDQVKAGDILALVDAAEAGQAKADLLQAAAQLRLYDKTLIRLADLGGIVAGKQTLEAQAARSEAAAAFRKAGQTLHNLGLPIVLAELTQQSDEELSERLHFMGLPPSITEQLDASRITANLIPVVAPRDGLVVTRNAVAGEVIDTARLLFTIVDTSRMWLMLNVPLEEVKYIAIGQQVNFRPDGTDHDSTGTLTWISTDVDTKTRTIQVRGELPNNDARLRNETFGAGQIVLREEQDAIVVPSTAVHWEGCCHIVFVRDKDYMKEGAYKVFHTRSVRPGVEMGNYTEMIAGLMPDEVIVTQGSGVLRAELLKGNLGAG